MIEVTRDGAVATVAMDHGPVNAMDLELLDGLVDTFADLDGDDQVAAVVLTGNDRAFCAGVDLKRILDGGEDYTRPFLAALSAAVAGPLRTSLPVVAAVNGHAIAGGAVLAGACDLVIGTDDPGARIGLAELAVGIPFPAIPIEVMRRRLGRDLGGAVWTAELYPPPAARARGFLDEVAPAGELFDRAARRAAALVAVPETTRRLTHDQLTRDVEDALAARADDWDARVADAWCSEDGRAAIAAFVDRTLTHPS